MAKTFDKDIQFYKFCSYGFLKNLRFFDPFLYLFFLSKGLSFFEIGLLVSWREIIVNILEIPAGFLADSMGRKRTMMTSFLAYILSFTIFYFSENFWIFGLSFLFYGFGDAFRQGTHKSMIVDYLRIKGWNDQKAHYYGHTRSWSQLGSALSSLLAAGMVVLTGDYQTVFLISTLPYFLNLLLIASYPEELNGVIVNNKKSVRENFKNVFADFLISLKQKSTLKTIGNLSLFSGFHKAAKDYLQPILETMALSLPVLLYIGHKERSAILIGICFFIIHIITAISSRYSGRFAELFKNGHRPLNITLFAGLITGIAAGIALHYGFLLFAGLCFMIIYIMENLRKPIGISKLTDHIKTEALTSSLSVQSQGETIFAALLAPILGLLADHVSISFSLIIVSSSLLIPALFLRSR